MIRRLCLILLTAPWLALSSCETEKPKWPPVRDPEIAEVVRNVIYASVEGKDLNLDVFIPAGKGPFPMIVYVPGGAWYKEKQEWLREPTCRCLCKQGYVVFNVSYRHAPQHTFPDHVNDVLGAIIWSKTNAARYNADPSRVAVAGDSAGANLAAMADLVWDDPSFTPSYLGDGKTNARAQANVLLFGVYDLVEMHNLVCFYAIFDNPKLAAERYLGGTPQQVPDKYRLASPIHHVRRDMSPTLVVCGSMDPLFHQSEAFHKKLDELCVPNAFYISVGDNHGFTMYPPPFTKGAEDCYAAIAAFLELELKYSRKKSDAPTNAQKK